MPTTSRSHRSARTNSNSNANSTLVAAPAANLEPLACSATSITPEPVPHDGSPRVAPHRLRDDASTGGRLTRDEFGPPEAVADTDGPPAIDLDLAEELVAPTTGSAANTPFATTSRFTTTIKPADLPPLWDAFTEREDPDAIEQLVEYYMATHVRRLAERLHSRLPNQVDIDDLIQEGYIGLRKALTRFNPERNIKFETFSSQRVVGAMRDYLRSIDTVPRLVRQRERKLQGLIEDFNKDEGRMPSDDELRNLMDLEEARFQKVMLHGRAHSMIQFNSLRSNGDGEGDDDSDPMRGFEDTRSAFGGSPQTRGEHEDLRAWVTSGFSRRDRLIVVLYYYERMTMKEVGHVLGISESRVSQRLDAILKSLRARLCDTGAEVEFY